jgi:hypothetical protein
VEFMAIVIIVLLILLSLELSQIKGELKSVNENLTEVTERYQRQFGRHRGLELPRNVSKCRR